MKKIILFILSIIVAFIIYLNVNAEVYDVVIPEAAIRVRVIANSNSLKDQSMKMKVKAMIEEELSPLLIGVDSIDVAREIISDSIDDLDDSIKLLFNEEDYSQDFFINFGNNYFPEKDYRGVHYDEGEYESLVIVIGEGAGDNWWCVLFPPLCLLEAQEDNVSDTEYQFFVVEMLEKIFS